MGCIPRYDGCPQDLDESCSGRQLTFCALGQVATFDCKDLGKTRCAAITEGGRGYAYCVM